MESIEKRSAELAGSRARSASSRRARGATAFGRRRRPSPRGRRASGRPQPESSSRPGPCGRGRGRSRGRGAAPRRCRKSPRRPGVSSPGVELSRSAVFHGGTETTCAGTSARRGRGDRRRRGRRSGVCSDTSRRGVPGRVAGDRGSERHLAGGRTRAGREDRQRGKQQKHPEARRKDSRHLHILAEKRPGYSTVTDFARLRG